MDVSTGIEVRAAGGDSDFRDLQDLLVAYEDDLPAELRHGSVPDGNALAREYAGDSAAFVAMYEREPIGCVAVKKLDRDTAAILRLFVKPTHRGIGAARLLTTTAIEFARSGGYKRMVLDTHKAQLQPAYRLYRSLGFSECSPYAAVTYRCPTFMELRLTD